jgi:hypothetical protein
VQTAASISVAASATDYLRLGPLAPSSRVGGLYVWAVSQNPAIDVNSFRLSVRLFASVPILDAGGFAAGEILFSTFAGADDLIVIPTGRLYFVPLDFAVENLPWIGVRFSESTGLDTILCTVSLDASLGTDSKGDPGPVVIL